MGEGVDEIEPAPDGQRFAALWEEHSRRVLAYALRHVDPDTAQEVLSETFLVAWRRLADVPGAPLPWLLVVARNTIANHRRSTYRRAVVHRELVHLERVAEAPAADVDPVERDAMLRALAALSHREREALLLTAWDGLSPAQAAQVAGCSTNAFTVRLSRARARLRRGVDLPEADPAGQAARTGADPPATARPTPEPPTAVVLTTPSPVRPR